MRFLGFISLVLVTLLAAITIAPPQARATVSTTTSSVTALGNGVTTVFSFAYPMVNSAYAVVVVTNTNVTPNVSTVLTSTQYTLTGVGTNSGTVTYPLSGSPLAAGFTIMISRVVPLVQTTSLCNQGPPFCAAERALDYLTYIAQQLQAQITAIIAGSITPTISVPSISRVTSGTTATAVTTYTEQYIIWASASGSTKTTTLFGCAAAYSGYKITVSDEQATAGLYPIAVTPSAGLITKANGTIGTSFSMAYPTASLTFVCDGSSTWVAG